MLTPEEILQANEELEAKLFSEAMTRSKESREREARTTGFPVENSAFSNLNEFNKPEIETIYITL